MPRITQVEPQKKSGRKHAKRFNIYLDGVFAFGADEDLVVEKRLVVGKEVLKQDLDKLFYGADVGKLMERIYSLFTIRQRSEKEVRDYLKTLSFKRKVKGKEEISPSSIDLVIEKLKQKNLLNDTEFAKAWIEARAKKKGIRAIQAELYKKGVNREVINETLEGVSDQEQTAQNLLAKKLKFWKGLTPIMLRKKALEFLMRRGFDYSLSRSIVDKLVKLGYDTDKEVGDYVD